MKAKFEVEIDPKALISILVRLVLLVRLLARLG